MVQEYLKKYKEELKKCINDLLHKETRYKQVPNLLTISRAIGMIPVNILLLNGNITIGIALITALLITDFFDGKIARKWNIQSKFGADLDAVCDKLMFLGLAIPLMINNKALIANFMLEGIISYINVLGRINGLDTKTVFAGKIKTCFLSTTLIIGYLTKFFGLNSTWFNILTSMTIGTQVITIDNYLKEYNDMKNKKLIKEQEKEQIINKEEIIKEQEKNLKEELIKEKDFLLNIQEPDIIKEPKKLKKEL